MRRRGVRGCCCCCCCCWWGMRTSRKRDVWERGILVRLRVMIGATRAFPPRGTLRINDQQRSVNPSNLQGSVCPTIRFGRSKPSRKNANANESENVRTLLTQIIPDQLCHFPAFLYIPGQGFPSKIQVPILCTEIFVCLPGRVVEPCRAGSYRIASRCFVSPVRLG